MALTAVALEMATAMLAPLIVFGWCLTPVKKK